MIRLLGQFDDFPKDWPNTGFLTWHLPITSWSSSADTLIPNNNNQIKNKYNTHGNNNDNDHDSSEKQE